MSRKLKKRLTRIAVSAVLFGIAALLPLNGVWRLGAFLAVYALIGWDILWKAVCGLIHGQALDENFLMALATVGAFATGEYPEGVLVMLLYQVGEWFQSYAVGKSRKSISALMDIRPDSARVERDGAWTEVMPEEVNVGERILIQPGERVPLDGVVTEGSSALDTVALTGESIPRDVEVGDEVISGCVNQSGVLYVEVTKPYAESTVSRILDLVENAGSRKAKAENFITKFARYYTPIVVGAAVLLALIPGLYTHEWSRWVYRAMVFLVISCPCALVISVPLSFFGGIGGASKHGILVKGSNYMEVLAKIHTIVFDKTGTLTKGVFRVKAVHPDHCDKAQLLEYAALAESFSTHPISRSLCEAYGKTPEKSRVAGVEEYSGRGIEATIDGKKIAVGNDKLMAQVGAAAHTCHLTGTVVHVAIDGTYAGHIVISDEIKPEAAASMQELKAVGVQKTVMLTGDRREVGEQVAKELGIDLVYTELLPKDKVEKVEVLLGQMEPEQKLAFVGDGINDAPVLSRADLGIAMGAMGSDAAIEAADVVLMDDNTLRIAEAVKIARKTLKIVKQNIVFVLLIKLIFLVMGAFGVANMWEAVFADVGVSIIAILNAMRTLRSSEK